LILFSELTVKELIIDYDETEINKMLNLLHIKGILKRANITEEQWDEARNVSKDRDCPLGDVLHAILARDNNSVLVTQDRHFMVLKDICTVKKPEELL